MLRKLRRPTCDQRKAIVRDFSKKSPLFRTGAVAELDDQNRNRCPTCSRSRSFVAGRCGTAALNPPETQSLLLKIIGEVVQEIAGQTKLPGESEIKSARFPAEVRSSAGHNGGSAEPTPPSPLRRIELHLPIRINSGLPIVAYRPFIMREYAERDLADPGFWLALIRVTSCVFSSGRGSRE